MGWGGGLILSKAQKTKFRRSQIGRHPNPSPAGERRLSARWGDQIQRSDDDGIAAFTVIRQRSVHWGKSIFADVIL